MIGIGLSIHQPSATSSGPTPLEELEAAFATAIAHDAVIAAWAVHDTTTASMSGSRTTTTAVTDRVGQFFDQKGSYDLVAADDDSKRPALTAGAIVYDGFDDTLQYASAGPSLTLSLITTHKGSKTALTRPFINFNANPRADWDSTSGLAPISSGTGTIYVDGVSYAARNTLATAVANGSVHTLEWRGATGSGFTNSITFGQSSTGQVSGVYMPHFILDEAQADLADARTDCAAYLALLHTYLGL